MARKEPDRTQIRALNDEMRTNGPLNPGRNRWVVTPGLVDLGPSDAAQAIEAVQTFTAFDTSNDPYGEHDFGAFDVAGARLFWKIDYYNTALDGGSPDPADPEVTTRVLTIMLAFEY